MSQPTPAISPGKHVSNQRHWINAFSRPSTNFHRQREVAGGGESTWHKTIGESRRPSCIRTVSNDNLITKPPKISVKRHGQFLLLVRRTTWDPHVEVCMHRGPEERFRLRHRQSPAAGVAVPVLNRLPSATRSLHRLGSRLEPRPAPPSDDK